MDKKNISVSGCSINVKVVKSRKNPRVIMSKAKGKFCSHESLACGEKFGGDLNDAINKAIQNNRKILS